ncbi:hypothetical protein [Rhodospirillum sp. A1_3_36]|uniref:hypothetical protein n=1 Tax=Rhodospirillum sp. A1_3_36 TaxID=3391666 RepID=UPI0039A52F9D
MVRPNNPSMPFARSKISAALDSDIYRGKKAKGEWRLKEFAEILSDNNEEKFKYIFSLIKSNKLNTKVSVRVVEYLKREYGFTEEIRVESNEDRAIQMVLDLCQPKAGIEYLRARAKYKRFYSPLENGEKEVDIVGSPSTGDTINFGAALRRQPDQDPGLYKLNRSKEYMIKIDVWDDTGFFYLISREPNGDSIWVYPSSWGRENHRKGSLLIPDNPPPAPISTALGGREVYGIVAAMCLDVPDAFLENEPTLLTPEDLQSIVGQLKRMGDSWSARRYDYIAD